MLEAGGAVVADKVKIAVQRGVHAPGLERPGIQLNQSEAAVATATAWLRASDWHVGRGIERDER